MAIFQKSVINKHLNNLDKEQVEKAFQKYRRRKTLKTDEIEWMKVFETKKEEAQTLKAEINKTDKEIDQMVYELYGLNEEEIAIIEKSL